MRHVSHPVRRLAAAFLFGETQMSTIEKGVDRFRTRRETAQLLRISLRTLRRLELRGDLPPRVRVSDRIFGWRDSQIDAFLGARTGGVHE